MKAKIYLAAMIIALMLMVVSCQEKGTMEKAGERADEIIDNVKEGEPPLKEKGPLEKIGESVDQSINGKK